MKDYKRILELKALLKKKSHFLFGARSTGKSTLIKTEFGKNANPPAGIKRERTVVSNDKMERKIEGFELMHWTSFIKLINSL